MNAAPLKLLVIEDNPEDCVLYKRLLSTGLDPPFEIISVDTAGEGLDLLQAHDFKCVLLDYRLPDMDGFEFLAALAGDGDSDKIAAGTPPIIFLTGQGNETIAVNAMKKGATDYLVKSVLTQDLLQRTILHAIEKKNAEKALRNKTAQLEQSVSELEKANRQIIEQQKALIEEERLKVLLQMAGATAHELNQPLMVLLGNIQLLELDRENPDKISKYIKKIETAGQRIADIVKKIQTIRHHEVKQYPGDGAILELDQNIAILSVEDTDDDYETLKRILSDLENICLLRAKTIAHALDIVNHEKIDLILLDYLLPSGTGIEFLIELDARNIEIPVVIVTGQGDEMVASRAIQAGAYDYLPKSKLSAKSLSRVITNALEKYRLKQEVREAVQRMADMSVRDQLTGLHNRRYFMEALEKAASSAGRYRTALSLGMIDLDHFKNINDTHGHPAGDEILKTIGELLDNSTRETDTACRYGGEEFAVIFPNTGLMEAEKMCERFRQMTEAKAVNYRGALIHVTVSIGLALFSDDADDPADDLLRAADMALYKAKADGRNCIALWEKQ